MPDPEFVYWSNQHARAKAYMESTIWLSDGFVVITGEIGSGKTTLLQSFLNELEDDVVYAVVSQTQLTATQFLQSALTEFGFKPFDKKKVELLDKLNMFLIEQYSAGKSELAEAFARGLRSAGMAAIAKHFPGHGAVVADSHIRLPVDRRGYGLLLDDMLPYERMLSTGVVAGVMLAHIVYREIDDMPAGFSAYWIQRELRSRLGFGGAVFCDDLSMKATAEYGSMGSRARLALDAGCDMILVCNDLAAALQAVGALNDYSNPLSLVRLARLHGTGQQLRESLQASEEWQAANAIFADWNTPPQLRLDA